MYSEGQAVCLAHCLVCKKGVRPGVLICIYLHKMIQRQRIKVSPCIFMEGTGQDVDENQPF